MHEERVIIFYLFHDRPELTATRLAHLALLNSDIQIIACYGGSPSLFHQIVQNVLLFSAKESIDISKRVDFVCTAVQEPWYNIDLLPADWFARYGQKYKFDTLLYLEYDVLMLDSVSEIISRHAIGDFAACVTDNTKTPDWDWLRRPSCKRFLEWRDKHFHISAQQPVLNAFAPIYLISRQALEQYAHLYENNQLPPVFVEIRLPNVLSLYGFTAIYNTFGPTVRWRPHYSFTDIHTEIQKASLSSPDAPRVFHPFYEAWPAGSPTCL